jgi:ribosomal protein S18 acetylase RimI-like enzyme
MTQALFEVESDPRIALVERGGYRRVAELLYLGRTAQPDSRWAATASANVSFEAYAGAEGRLHRLIEESYVGSLDCPAIDGVRPVEETLAGYRATGQFDPESWRIAVVEGRDAGVVIVAPHDDSDQAELVYMGLAPWARGRGLGRCLVDEAMRRATFLGADLLIAAVDATNTPARRVYEAAGFATWSRRFVFIRTPPLDLAAATESAPCDP